MNDTTWTLLCILAYFIGGFSAFVLFLIVVAGKRSDN